VTALETEILSLKAANKPFRLFTEGPRAFLLNDKGRIFHIGLKVGKLVLNVKEKNNIKGNRPAGILPDGDITYDNRNIKAAWLTGTTRRYDHGVLGDDVEAIGMAIELAGGRRLELKLGPESVFEDRLARLTDLDGDGKDEIIAETWPIRIPHRWLNPVGVGNFDGNGRAQVALVKTPHIGGKLEIYALESGSLRLKGKPAIFKPYHWRTGTGEGGVIDIDGDGVHEIVLPGSWKRTIRIISFMGGEFSELARINFNGSSTDTAIAASDLDEDGDEELVFGLSDGRLMAVIFKP